MCNHLWSEKSLSCSKCGITRVQFLSGHEHDGHEHEGELLPVSDHLKKELTELYKKYNLLLPDTVGQIVSHINEGRVSKVWQNVEVK